MITKKHFTEAIAILEDRFNREHSGPTLAAYFDVIRAELTVDEFQRACRECFRRDTFFPAPQRLIDLARGGSEEDLAERSWHELLQVLGSENRLDWDGLSHPMREALRIVKPYDIQNATPYERQQLRKDFVRLFTAAARGDAKPEVPHKTPQEIEAEREAAVLERSRTAPEIGSRWEVDGEVVEVDTYSPATDTIGLINGVATVYGDWARIKSTAVEVKTLPDE